MTTLQEEIANDVKRDGHTLEYWHGMKTPRRSREASGLAEIGSNGPQAMRALHVGLWILDGNDDGYLNKLLMFKFGMVLCIVA